MQKISSCLWFNNNAEEAVAFYSSIFNVKTIAKSYYPAGSPGPEGSIMTILFSIEGREYLALNGGPAFTFTEAFSMIVYCDDQAELDDKWNKLLAGGGKEQMCGWLKDKFGLCWQVVPYGMEDMMGGKNPEGAKRAMDAMMKMIKIDIKAIQDAYNGK